MMELGDWVARLEPDMLFWSTVGMATAIPLSLVAHVFLLVTLRRHSAVGLQQGAVEKFMTAVSAEEMFNSLVPCTLYVVFTLTGFVWPGRVCTLFLWSFSAVHVLLLVTTTSMVLDRILLLKWAYKYKYHVTIAQIRYHVIVLVLMASLMASVTAFQQPSGALDVAVCAFLPFSMSPGYPIFVTAIYGVLIAVMGVAILVLLFHPASSRTHDRAGQNSVFAIDRTRFGVSKNKQETDKSQALGQITYVAFLNLLLAYLPFLHGGESVVC